MAEAEPRLDLGFLRTQWGASLQRGVTHVPQPGGRSPGRHEQLAWCPCSLLQLCSCLAERPVPAPLLAPFSSCRIMGRLVDPFLRFFST